MIREPDLAALLRYAGQTFVRSNILSPLLWLTLVVTPLSFVLAAFGREALSVAFLVIGCSPPTAVIAVFLYCLKKTPTMLFSERHQERAAALTLLGDERYKSRDVIALMSTEKPTPNPYLTGPDQGDHREAG